VLSPRPAHVAQCIVVTLPRPRMRNAASRAEAALLESTILDLLFSPPEGQSDDAYSA
jgi:hypothetical protein